MSRLSICCLAWCARARLSEKRRYCATNSPATISRPSVQSARRANFFFGGRSTPSTVNSLGVIEFLEQLQQQIVGKLLIIWDGAPIHRSRVIKEYLAAGAATRIHLERFPGYAPELNPDEGIWHYLKHVEMKNLCCEDMAHLHRELSAAQERLEHRPEIIQACFEQVGYL